jgi:hypothetical protein
VIRFFREQTATHNLDVLLTGAVTQRTRWQPRAFAADFDSRLWHGQQQ